MWAPINKNTQRRLIMGWLSGQYIDIIEWLDNGQETMVYRFERHNNEIKNGAKLIVRPGQTAIFVNEGGTSIADVFPPGTHELTTANLPVLSTLMGWKYGFESPFKAEVYFMKTTEFSDLKWGTRHPIPVMCAGYGGLELRANGTYVMRISDPKAFLEQRVGTDSNFQVDSLVGDLREEILLQVTDCLGEMELDPFKLAGKTKDISDELQGPIQEYFEPRGLTITRFRVTSINMPDDVRKELMELSRLDATKLKGADPSAMQNLTALRASRAMGDMAKNPGGTGAAGAGMEVAMGMMMANQVGGALAGAAQPQQGAPPPLPGAKPAAAPEYTVAIDKQKYGPYGLNRLQDMANDGSFTADMLVWAKGMGAWTKAGEVSDLAGLFGPPPLPGNDEPPPLP
ncbi:MAG: antifreeze protein [Verrucomicrobiales bacterium]|nr:antifreeze protein [Verrucomicrobiales bacterium]